MTTNQFYRDKTLPLSDLEKILPQSHHPETRGKAIPVADFAKLLSESLAPAIRLLFKPNTLRQWSRLLYQGIDPILLLLLQASNTALIDRWIHKGTKVVFLSSFPRSGNTWMRFMLSDVLLQMHGVETKTQLPVHPDNLIPEFWTNSMVRRITRCPSWAFEPSLAFVKTHSVFERLQDILSGHRQQNAGAGSDDGAPFRGCRIVYVYRAPEDALVSLYHLKIRDHYAHSRAIHSVDSFCRAEVSGWVKNISSYLRAADNGLPVFFVSYERLLEASTTIMCDLLRWLDVPHDSPIAQRAVSNMQFGKLHAMEIEANKTRSPGHEKRLFFRRGGPGSGRAELQESTLQEIRHQTEALLSAANHLRMKQLSAHQASAPVDHNLNCASVPLSNGDTRQSEISPRPR